MSTLLPATETTACKGRSFRPAMGSVAVFMLIGFSVSTLQGNTQSCTQQTKQIKSSGKFNDDPLPEKPPEGWQEYIQEKFKAYSVWLPSTGRKLLQTEGSIQFKVNAKTFKVGYVILKCDIDNDVKLNIERLIVPLGKGEMLDAAAVIEAFRDMHVEDYDGTITEEYDLMLGKMQGKEYRMDIKGGEKSRVRIYQVGKAIWKVWVTGTKEQVMGDKTKLIFSSFKNQMLLKDPPAKKP